MLQSNDFIRKYSKENDFNQTECILGPPPTNGRLFVSFCLSFFNKVKLSDHYNIALTLIMLQIIRFGSYRLVLLKLCYLTWQNIACVKHSFRWNSLFSLQVYRSGWFVTYRMFRISLYQ